MKRLGVISAIGGGIGGLLVLAASVPLDEATGNLVSWLKPLGQEPAKSILFWVGITVIVIALILPIRTLLGRIDKRLGAMNNSSIPERTDHWADRTKMNLMELANVSAGRRPNEQPMSGEPELSRYHVLKEVVDDGKLKANAYGPQADYAAEVKYEDFHRFAAKAGTSWIRDLDARWSRAQPIDSHPQTPASSLMPLVELLREAEKEEWRFTDNGSQHIFDFVRGLRDAGSTRSIAMWGRKNQRIKDMTKDQALVEIDPSYWREFKIDGISCLQIGSNGGAEGIATKNLQTMTQDDANIAKHGLYADLRLDRDSALNWLVTEALDYRGKSRERVARWHESPLSDPEPGLHAAAFWAIFQSAWGKWHKHNPPEQVTDEETRIRILMQTVAFTVEEAAKAGNLTLKGRPPGEIEYEPITSATWKLAALNVVADNAAIMKFEVVPRHEVDPERIKKVLSYDSLVVNFEQFESVFAALGPDPE